MTSPAASEIQLFSSPISDASARVRIALGIKDVAYKLTSIRLSKEENNIDEIASVNPARTVPTLVIENSDVDGSANPLVLVQSRAILEYLDERFPNTHRLLPPTDQLSARAQARSLVDIIGSDTHPLTTHRVGREIPSRFPCPESAASKDTKHKDWNVHWITRGLSLYENMASGTAGQYSVGDMVTVADVFLIPELWTAQRLGVDIERFPTIMKIYRNLMQVEAVRREQHNPELEK